jgi:thiamine-phosphate diphosphorylase
MHTATYTYSLPIEPTLFRIDIALAINADGVHVGQSDMPLSLARQLLPRNAIIGVSANSPEEAAEAARGGADYVGVGPVWDTKTKKDIKGVLGVRGIGAVLDALEGGGGEGRKVKAVGIGECTRTLRIFEVWMSRLIQRTFRQRASMRGMC